MRVLLLGRQQQAPGVGIDRAADELRVRDARILRLLDAGAAGLVGWLLGHPSKPMSAEIEAGLFQPQPDQDLV